MDRNLIRTPRELARRATRKSNEKYVEWRGVARPELGYAEHSAAQQLSPQNRRAAESISATKRLLGSRSAGENNHGAPI